MQHDLLLLSKCCLFFLTIIELCFQSCAVGERFLQLPQLMPQTCTVGRSDVIRLQNTAEYTCLHSLTALSLCASCSESSSIRLATSVRHWYNSRSTESCLAIHAASSTSSSLTRSSFSCIKALQRLMEKIESNQTNNENHDKQYTSICLSISSPSCWVARNCSCRSSHTPSSLYNTLFMHT